MIVKYIEYFLRYLKQITRFQSSSLVSSCPYALASGSDSLKNTPPTILNWVSLEDLPAALTSNCPWNGQFSQFENEY